MVLTINFSIDASFTEKRQFLNLFASIMGEEQSELPEIDWRTIIKKSVKLKVKEFEIDEKILFQKVEECVKKCLEKSNPDRLYRDNCIAKLCDIY